MGVYDSLANGEPDPHAAACAAVKGLEDIRNPLRRNPGSPIRHADHHFPIVDRARIDNHQCVEAIARANRSQGILQEIDQDELNLQAVGEDRAGIVASLCRVLADRGVNIAELSTRSQPGPGGSPHYELNILAEVPEGVEKSPLEAALDGESDRLVIDIRLEYS